jgi:hypothetical protein
MLADPTQRKTLTDARGVDHEWTCMPFGSLDSITMLAKLADVVLGGGARNLDQLLDIDVKQLREDAAAGGAKAAGLLTAFSGIPARLLAHGGGALVADIMAGCTRSYKDLAGKRHVLDLSDPKLFDSIGRGNLGEVVSALWWVLEVNYGPLFGGVLSSFGALLTAGTAKPSDGEEDAPTNLPASV